MSDDDFDAALARLDERIAATDERLVELHEQVEALSKPEGDDRHVPRPPTMTPFAGVWMLRVTYTDHRGMEHTMTDWAISTESLRQVFEDAVEVTENLISGWEDRA